jgi:hypothetical protein
VVAQAASTDVAEAEDEPAPLSARAKARARSKARKLKAERAAAAAARRAAGVPGVQPVLLQPPGAMKLRMAAWPA